MKTSDFDYFLPPDLIAQTPIEPRDASRLLVLDRQKGSLLHRHFRDLGSFLRPGDLLVFNRTRVIPARLHGVKVDTGGAVEFLLLHAEGDASTWRGLIGGRRVAVGSRLRFQKEDGVAVEGVVIAEGERSERVIRFDSPLRPLLDEIGEIPLPPYIHTPLADAERYQTIYARDEGSAAAPTAGLHFTPELVTQLLRDGIEVAYCTLHVGLDTFQPVNEDDLEDHEMHSERVYLSPADAAIINRVRRAGGRVIAVGTTSVRTLETAGNLSAGIADPYSDAPCPGADPVVPVDGPTRLFIHPGYPWRVVDGMITNFHLPKSTLLMLVSAFAGRENVLAAYAAAREERYRFYSFGDAMLII